MRVLLVVAIVAGLVGPAAGSTFVVNSTLDTDDKSADGQCRDANNKCTLRAALTEANRDPGADVIHFNITGTGIKTIALAAAPGFSPAPLPVLHPVTIDATTQSGYAGTPLIEIDGGPHGTYGIQLFARGCEVHGLLLKNFQRQAMALFGDAACLIRANHFIGNQQGLEIQAGSEGAGPTLVGGLTGADRNVFAANQTAITVWNGSRDVQIVGNYIGTDTTGTTGAGNVAYGIYVDDASAVIRGNVISGNNVGVLLERGAGDKVVEGNFIGTDATGTSAIPNQIGVRVLGANSRILDNTIAGNSSSGIELTGIACIGTVVQRNKIGVTSDGLIRLVNPRGIAIEAGASESLIGGDTEEDGNIIGGGSSAGIAIINTQTVFDLSTQTRDNVVRGNRIGVSANGTSVSNHAGVLVSGAARNTIDRNRIAFNAAAIAVVGIFARDNEIRRNSIYSNSAFQAIDLDWNGVTPNDTLDADSGPNNLQNTAYVQVGIAGAQTWIGGQLHSSPSETFELDVFASSSCFNAALYLGSTTIETDVNGNGSFLVPVAEVAPSTFITTTVTSQSGSTSEPSYCEPATTCTAVSFFNGPELVVGSVGNFYNDYLYLQGTQSPHTMRVIDGVLPPGLTLGNDGTISGVPLTDGAFTFTVRATTTRGCTGEITLTLRVCDAIRVHPDTLGTANTTVMFTTMLTASGGTPPYTFSAPPVLPLGLELYSSGLLTGTPREEGLFFIPIDVLDAGGCWGTKQYELTVGCPSLFVDQSSLPFAELGAELEVQLTAGGGVAPYTFRPADEFPAGLSISRDGVLTGKPRAQGTVPVGVRVRDALGCETRVTLTLHVTVTTQPGCDCQSAVDPQLVVVVLIAALARRRRRPRQARAITSFVGARRGR